MFETSTLINFGDLLDSSSDVLPARTVLPYTLRDELDRARRGETSGTVGPDDSNSPKRPRATDWEKIIQVTQDWLAHRSKDLGLAARLTEALARVHGFAGLRDGLTLMRRLVEECWDRLTPMPDGDDGYEGRLSPLRWLDEPDRGALFPHTLRSIPLVRADAKSYGWAEWRRIQAECDSSAWKEFAKALRETPLSDCESNIRDLVDSESELDRLVAAVVRYSGQVDFEMPAFKQAIRDCGELARQILEHHPERAATLDLDEIPSACDESPGFEGADPAEFAGMRPIYSREQIYDLIAHLAALLRQLEPHSPVPYLLDRAVELGSLPFPQLMKEILRDQTVLSRVNLELGIKDDS
jgi:type VI secretion system protein ImpA